MDPLDPHDDRTPPGTTPADPYAVLAFGYDRVMEHVDYAGWADFVQELLDQHAPGLVGSVLELGCGTGSFAFELQPYGPYRYAGTDASPAMIAVAQARAKEAQADVTFRVGRFEDAGAEGPVDAVLLLYDGLNYVLDEPGLRRLFAAASAALRPGGLFVFDQSTPANSLHNEDAFSDEGTDEGFAFVRRSAYDREARLHVTTFEVDTPHGRFFERHVQKAYTMAEVRALAEEAFTVEAAYDGFSLDPAHDETERVHWVARKG